MCPAVRIWNPRKNKTLTREQVESRQAKAVRFVEDVLGDPDLADAIEGLSVDEYAKHKGLELSNPDGKEAITMVKEQAVVEKLDELVRAVKARRTNVTNPGTREVSGAKEQRLLEKLDELIQVLKESRQNPSGPGVTPARGQAQRVERKLRAERDEILDALEDAQDALDEGEYDEAQEILSRILDQYETEEEGAEEER